MLCPHCKNDTYSFNKVYAWPFGKKLCPVCNNYSRIKKDWRLAVASILLGMMPAIPVLLFNELWYLLPSFALSFCADYFMDRKFRVLTVA